MEPLHLRGQDGGPRHDGSFRVELQGGQPIHRQGVRLHSPAIEQRRADGELGRVHLPAEDELRCTGDDVHCVARSNQMPRHFHDSSGVTESMAGHVVGEHQLSPSLRFFLHHVSSARFALVPALLCSSTI
ncbi:hypothetical protein Mapa_009976 [Marchantia paleacea]|nr:hypothetical protein Mapa_009976 [Marchantia paleacea]